MKNSLIIGLVVAALFFADALKTSEQGYVSEMSAVETTEQEFAIKSALAVDSQLPVGAEFYVDKAYVRTGEDTNECMLYAKIKDTHGERTDIYRVAVYDDDPLKMNVYFTIDPESDVFLKFYNSTDSKAREYAETLKSYSDAITAADKEIQIGSPDWTKIDCTIINKALKKPEEAAAGSP